MQYKVKTTINDCDRRNFVMLNTKLCDDWVKTRKDNSRASLNKYVKANRAKIDKEAIQDEKYSQLEDNAPNYLT